MVIMREFTKGVKVGLVKLRLFRLFPRERLARALKEKKAVGVIDRSVCFGWNCGPIYTELRAVAPDRGGGKKRQPKICPSSWLCTVFPM